MRIMISASDKTAKAMVSEHFGRSPYFAFYSELQNHYDFLRNSAVNHERGAGISIAQLAVDQGVGAIICKKLGPKALRIIQENQIPVYESPAGTLEDVVDAFKKGTLIRLV